MINFYKKPRFSENHDTIDALLALQMLEDQEQSQEQEFFRLTGEIQQFGLNGKEVENTLPALLKTKREQALYEALMTLVHSSRHTARFHIQAKECGGIEHELRELR